MPPKPNKQHENGNGTHATQDHNGLAREHVASIQRARVLDGMAQACVELGLANVTVAHVVERAGVSRRTFYEFFVDIHDCFRTAFEDGVARATRGVLGAHDPRLEWFDRTRECVLALLSFFDEEPNVARLLVVESLGAGPEILRARHEVLATVIAVVDEGRKDAKRGAAPPPLTAESTVGGVLAVLHARLSEQSAGSVIELARSLMSMIAYPYRGAAAARRELTRPLPKTTQASSAAAANPLNQMHMRLTYRTVRVLTALAASPGSSNRQVADSAGIVDQGQMSKLLGRLLRHGLIENANAPAATRGEANAWTLTDKGWLMHGALAKQAES